MKAFESRYEGFAFPEDMNIIIENLSRKGHINVREKILEKLHEEFSEERWCRWKVLDAKTLDDFAEWLLDKDV